MQALSIRSSTREQVATELRDTQARLSEVLPRLIAAREQLEQAEVRAPASGQVVGLTTHTVGGVVAPGQTLMDVVPQNRMLIIQAQVNPQDADDVFIDQTAQVRFTSVHDTTLPLLPTGRVRTISADSFTEEQTGRTYFRAEIAPATAGHSDGPRPVEAVMNVRKRKYILEPVALAREL